VKLNRDIALTIVCLILGLILAAQYKSVSNNNKLAEEEQKTRNELYKEQADEREINRNLTTRNQELNKEAEAFKNDSDNLTKIKTTLNDDILRMKILAGLVDVKGKGVIVTIDNNGPSLVEDENILDVINDLRASDAQAISVNDERIVAMSEVREAGTYIMVNGKRMTPPYVIKAIGDPDKKLEPALKMIGGILERLELSYSLKVDLKKADDIVIPKVADDGSVLKYDKLTPVEIK
jgi:uncharacterized protein YlxW (UPF0749 family)